MEPINRFLVGLAYGQKQGDDPCSVQSEFVVERNGLLWRRKFGRELDY
jgi:hypothetical protein